MPGHLSELHPVNEVNTKGQFFRASVGKKPQVPKTARQAASLPGDIFHKRGALSLYLCFFLSVEDGNLEGHIAVVRLLCEALGNHI